MKNWILGAVYALGLILVYWVGVQHTFNSQEKYISSLKEENNNLKTYISLRKELECGK